MQIGGSQGPFVEVTKIDLEKAFEYYQKSAALDDPRAQNYLGSFYFNYRHEYDKAVKLFR